MVKEIHLQHELTQLLPDQKRHSSLGRKKGFRVQNIMTLDSTFCKMLK